MKRSRHSTRRYAIVIAWGLVAFAVALLANRAYGWRHTQENQGDAYVGYAAALLWGQGFRSCPIDGFVICEAYGNGQTAYRYPAYPALLAIQLAAYGTDDPLPPLRITQALLAASTVMLTVGLAARLYGSTGAAFAGVPMLLTSDYLWLSGHLMTEFAFTTLLLVLVYWFLRRTGRGVLPGVLAGVLLLLRGSLLPALPLLWLLLYPRQRGWFALGVAVVLVPWIIRNALVLDAFVPFTTISGDVLIGAHNPYVQPGSWMWIRNTPDWERYTTAFAQGEVVYDRTLQAAALEYVRGLSPGQVVMLEIAKVRQLFLTDTWFVLLGLLGIPLLVRRHRRAALVFGALLAALLANTLVFYGSARLRFPFDPLFAVLGAGVVVDGVRRFGAMRFRRRR